MRYEAYSSLLDSKIRKAWVCIGTWVCAGILIALAALPTLPPKTLPPTPTAAPPAIPPNAPPAVPTMSFPPAVGQVPPIAGESTSMAPQGDDSKKSDKVI